MRAFTLVEILIVVIILGILAAVVVPNFVSASESARQSAFVSDIRVFSDAAVLHKAQTGEWVDDGGSGMVPPGFAGYIDQDQWERGTSLGGLWDAERNSFGVRSAIGVHFMNGDDRGDAYMTEVDAIFDDGVLATGGFRRLAAERYYAVIAN
jgi:general secretion pathway protein G